jgi:type I restriction enzyme M protein
LDEEAARRLITEPTEQDIFDPYAVHEIIRLTAGHPYFVQLLCHYMVDFRNRSHLQTITVQHVRDAIRDILVQAEGHLTHLWRTAPPLYQLVMASASRVLARQDSVQASDVVEQLAAYRVDQDPQQVLSAAEALAGQEIFERLEGDPPRYRFRVELIRRWIERNQPLSLVVGSLP